MLSFAQSTYLLKQAPQVFSRMFEQLILACFISQSELSRRAIDLRDEMIKSGILQKGDSLGSMARQTVSCVIDNQQRPSQGQLLIWFEVLKRWCDDDPDMLAKVNNAKIYPPISKPRFPSEIEKDFYRLALFGTLEEIKEAYEYWKDYSLFDYLEDKQCDTGEMPACRIEPQTDRVPGGVDQVRHAIRNPELQR